MKALRNQARCRRNTGKLFDDLNILLNEANFCDERILKKLNMQIKHNNTVALTMTINTVLEQKIEYLLFGIEL